MDDPIAEAKRRTHRAAPAKRAPAPGATRAAASSGDGRGSATGGHGVRLSVLVREELRALPRNTFALASATIVLGMFAVLGALIYSGEGGLEEKLLFTWLAAELVVAVIVAARVAAVRRNRFVDSLYTTPLDQRTWLAAQAIVGLVLVLLVVAIQVPFLLVHVAWLGVPASIPLLLAGALGVGLFAVALGLFCGVVVGDSPPTAAAGLAGGIAFVTFVLMIVHGVVMTSPASPTTDLWLRVTALSPVALMFDAVGIDLFGKVADRAWRPVVGLAGMVLGLASAGWLAYTRAQTPLGWDARGGRIVVVALATLAVVAPLATAETTFVAAEDDDIAWDPGNHTQVAFVPRGAPILRESFTMSQVAQGPDLPVGKAVHVDALVLALAPEDSTVRSVRIEVRGSEDVRVESGGILTVPDGTPSGYAPPGKDWDSTEDGPSRPVYRVPVTLRALHVESLGNSPLLVEVHTSFRADQELLTSAARIDLDGEVPGAAWQLMAAGMVLPSTAATALALRKRRTR
jgi:hypothetical protein